jgi:hypothetical protein
MWPGNSGLLWKEEGGGGANRDYQSFNTEQHALVKLPFSPPHQSCNNMNFDPFSYKQLIAFFYCTILSMNIPLAFYALIYGQWQSRNKIFIIAILVMTIAISWTPVCTKLSINLILGLKCGSLVTHIFNVKQWSPLLQAYIWWMYQRFSNNAMSTAEGTGKWLIQEDDYNW